MHMKSWLFDDQLLVAGSANASTNSTENCAEMMFAIRAADAVLEHGCVFEKIWRKAKRVTTTHIETLAGSEFHGKQEAADQRKIALTLAQGQKSVAKQKADGPPAVD